MQKIKQHLSMHVHSHIYVTDRFATQPVLKLATHFEAGLIHNCCET